MKPITEMLLHLKISKVSFQGVSEGIQGVYWSTNELKRSQMSFGGLSMSFSGFPRSSRSFQGVTGFFVGVTVYFKGVPGGNQGVSWDFLWVSGGF